MRSMWQGAISFGLVNIPVRMYLATMSKDLRFNQLHAGCNAPIEYHKVCSACRNEVRPEELIRGFAYERGRYVVVADEELEGLAPERSRAIEIVDFVDLSEIDPVYFDKSYYLEPTETAQKAFGLLHGVMSQKQRVAIAKIVIRTRASLCALRSFEHVLALSTLYYPDEVRPAAELHGAGQAKPTARELSLAEALVDSLTRPFDPGAYQDEYRIAVSELIERKVAGDDVHVAPAAAATDKVLDLMSALEASLGDARARADDHAPVH